MKKILSSIVVGLFLMGGVANAQTQNVISSPGITPDSPFYFLDRLGENLQEFFTFDKVAKANLQIKFADERIAEIKYLVDTKGPDTKGIEEAKSLLVGNVARAAEIIQEVKSSGKDVTKLAKNLNDQFNNQEKLLIDTFQEARKKLNKDHLVAVQNLIKQAQKTGDLEKVKNLEKQLQGLVAKDVALKNKKNEIKQSFRKEKKKIEKDLSKEDKNKDKEDKINNDKKEKSVDNELDKEKEHSNEKLDKEKESKNEKLDKEKELEKEQSDRNEANKEDNKDNKESAREDAKQNAEDSQRNLENSLENSNLSESAREALKKTGEKAREDSKQNAETTDGENKTGE